MNNLIDQEVKIKKTGRKAIVVDHIDNHFALSYLDGKEVLNKTYDLSLIHISEPTRPY